MPEKDACGKCDGKCCRHIALEIDKPDDAESLDDIRWYLSHQGVQVFVEDGKWHLQVYTRCRYLDEDFSCTNYAKRPGICRSYKLGNCEFSKLDFGYELHFKSDADFEAYLAEKKKARHTPRSGGRRAR